MLTTETEAAGVTVGVVDAASGVELARLEQIPLSLLR
jgi:hypothetical protein